MGRPAMWQHFRQTIGRALRETGQALDRLGIKGDALATTRKAIGDDPVIYQDFLSRHRQFMPLLRRGKPVVSNDVAFIAPCATLIGSVYVGPNSSIFYKSILRADNCDNAEAFNDNPYIPSSIDNGDDVAAIADAWVLNPDRLEKHHRSTGAAIGGGIFIGENTNIQDGCIIDSAKGHTRIGNGVTVGHLASIHSATIEDHCLIGMGSLIPENVLIKEESFIAAGAKLSPNTVVESGELWVGQPARKLRDLSPEERQRLHYQANEVCTDPVITNPSNAER
jgi:gamma-carbonic anhydrase